MSEHSTGDEKLRVTEPVRLNNPAKSRQSEPPADSAPQVPPKGSNANNQYR